jgi:hypothetical protein
MSSCPLLTADTSRVVERPRGAEEEEVAAPAEGSSWMERHMVGNTPSFLEHGRVESRQGKTEHAGSSQDEEQVSRG